MPSAIQIKGGVVDISIQVTISWGENQVSENKPAVGTYNPIYTPAKVDPELVYVRLKH